jgi:hypothetical protein
MRLRACTHTRGDSQSAVIRRHMHGLARCLKCRYAGFGAVPTPRGSPARASASGRRVGRAGRLPRCVCAPAHTHGARQSVGRHLAPRARISTRFGMPARRVRRGSNAPRITCPSQRVRSSRRSRRPPSPMRLRACTHTHVHMSSELRGGSITGAAGGGSEVGGLAHQWDWGVATPGCQAGGGV